MKALLMLRDAFYEANPNLIQDIRGLGVQLTSLYTDNGISKKDLLKQVENVDIIVVAVVRIDKELIDHARNLKYILKFGAGYDNIDVAYAQQKGITVTNALGQNASSAADLAFGLMLAAARSIPFKDKEIKEKHWELSVGNEMEGKRLGIIGFGAIGKAIAKRATGFDMKTVAFGNYKDYEIADKLQVQFVELEELLKTSDFIVLSTTIHDKNRQMINRDSLRLMKKTAFLINVSRGGLVNEHDLIEALKQNVIRGAALDVFETEPTTGELAYLPNVVATPHIGGATVEAVRRTGQVTSDNIARFIKGEELRYVIPPTSTKSTI
ncbi:phosphoglycerate dehydrogenase [Aquibacillus albus]|uniref:D-3-phosphoglycerate dehydrogenase n=1 Tax=Aquibacillus albus TaxID=1168171 RepID=A0ABS2MX13_9BACI|nr:phosphoglycerate dehydrogenase [Aquibacillus albus]MBM7570400.1 D-3-phosphoglycerate dehydrogenase [Aquibacillus albus]